MSDEALPTILEFDVNPDEIEAPPALPKSWYQGSIIETSTKLREKSGKLGVDVVVLLAPEVFPADFDAEYYPDGMKLVYRMLHWESDRGTLYRIKKFCNAIGVEFHSGVDHSDWVGSTAWWDVRVGKDLEDNDRNEVMGVNDEPKE